MSWSPASRSSIYMAVFRAIESSKPADKRLLYDPFAAAFVDKRYQTAIACCAFPLFRRLFTAYIQFFWPGTYTAGIARTRLIDDMIVEAVDKQGINQVIILNARIDTRAHRLKTESPVQFVEIDHPESQYRKQQRLYELLEEPAKFVDYIPLDINTQPMSEVFDQLLQRQHYKTLFLWEGLTSDLKAREADTIFRYINRFPAGTQVIFTYMNKAALDNPTAYRGFRRIARTMRAGGDKWNYGMHPAEWDSFMRERNMRVLYEGGADKYRAQYFGAAANHMHGYEYFCVVKAELK
ncbi:class I SAM-dependent methyltransferase [Chitinophaga vietnamensis]|uniref:class I SAM-dependent methyltransferase n=1 Tax=Chitinophaga vietnamensis TaxID=2593957 RepID=UPI0011789BE3|nr:SAM-dependent methyltransferase [Chitinophaga vietnamensis]